MVLGAIFVFLSYNFSKRTFSFPVLIFGLAIIFLSRTTSTLLEGMTLINAGPTVGLCIAGILGGAILIYVMAQLLGNTNPHSTDFGQFMMFGWHKCDDFAGMLLFGVVIVFLSVTTLWDQMFRSWEYARANASVQALATNPNKAKETKPQSAKAADTKKTAIKQLHKTAKLHSKAHTTN